MLSLIEQFRDSMLASGKKALNSINAYTLDISEFNTFLNSKQVKSLTDAGQSDVASFILQLKTDGKSAATVNRKMASIRAFYKFLNAEGIVDFNPTLDIKPPKIARKEIQYLTIEEVETLLATPDDSVKGIRDKAILEVLYATGVRVSELIQMELEHVNLRMGFVTCTGEHGKARIIPLGRPSREALENYIYECRDKLIKDKSKNIQTLFLNYYGNCMTRQALWKILKEYAQKSNLNKKITPQILRNSFAAHMVQNGADLKSLQELLGHEDPTATQVYLSVSKNRIKDVYDNTHPRA